MKNIRSATAITINQTTNETDQLAEATVFNWQKWVAQNQPGEGSSAQRDRKQILSVLTDELTRWAKRYNLPNRRVATSAYTGVYCTPTPTPYFQALLAAKYTLWLFVVDNYLDTLEYPLHSQFQLAASSSPSLTELEDSTIAFLDKSLSQICLPLLKDSSMLTQLNRDGVHEGTVPGWLSTTTSVATRVGSRYNIGDNNRISNGQPKSEISVPNQNDADQAALIAPMAAAIEDIYSSLIENFARPLSPSAGVPSSAVVVTTLEGEGVDTSGTTPEASLTSHSSNPSLNRQNTEDRQHFILSTFVSETIAVANAMRQEVVQSLQYRFQVKSDSNNDVPYKAATLLLPNLDEYLNNSMFSICLRAAGTIALAFETEPQAVWQSWLAALEPGAKVLRLSNDLANIIAELAEQKINSLTIVLAEAGFEPMSPAYRLDSPEIVQAIKVVKARWQTEYELFNTLSAQLPEQLKANPINHTHRDNDAGNSRSNGTTTGGEVHSVFSYYVFSSIAFTIAMYQQGDYIELT